MPVARLACWTVVCSGLLAAEARAHFLFIRIGPPAEAGRAAEVFFSEQAEAGDPRFVAKIAHTKLWLLNGAGKIEPLPVVKAADRLRAHLPVAGPVAVFGECQYGVLARPKKVPFLLRYYPKAVAGNPDELNRMRECGKVPLEIVAKIEGERILLTALRNGKPVPRAVFHTVDSSLGNEQLTADADGRATWKPSSPDTYSVYTSYTTKEAGKLGDQPYEETREFATLAFTWPVVSKGADPKAVALFEDAIATRAQWKGFPGFRAHIGGKVDGRAFHGTVTIDASGAVQLKTDDDAIQTWVQDQLESVAMHRGAGSEGGSAGKRTAPVLRFGDAETDHPLGRLLIFEGGRFASSYRVKDKQITVVNRNIGKRNMTITVLDNSKNEDGKFLPRSYTVHYWDAATGVLLSTEAIVDHWARVGAWDLPTTHTVTTASGSGFSVRSFTITKHELLARK
jgi:hypothetical protein